MQKVSWTPWNRKGETSSSRLVEMILARGKNVLGPVIDLFLPRICPSCGYPLTIPSSTPICQSCLEQLSPVKGPLCTRCGIPFKSTTGIDHICSRCRNQKIYYNWARSLFVYQGPVKSLIGKYKYNASMSAFGALVTLASPLIQALMESKGLFKDSGPQCVVPVPIHRNRLRARGFNQAVELSLALFKGLSLRYSLVIKIRDNPPQAGLAAVDRPGNIKGVFKASGSSPKDILIFDDVITTGSTVNELARVLRSAGAENIYVITIARTI